MHRAVVVDSADDRYPTPALVKTVAQQHGLLEFLLTAVVSGIITRAVIIRGSSGLTVCVCQSANKITQTRGGGADLVQMFTTMSNRLDFKPLSLTRGKSNSLGSGIHSSCPLTYSDQIFTIAHCGQGRLLRGSTAAARTWDHHVMAPRYIWAGIPCVVECTPCLKKRVPLLFSR